MRDLNALIALMRDAAPFTAKERDALWRQHSQSVTAKMLQTGESYGAASGGPSFLTLPEDQARSHIKSIDNDLAAQIEIVRSSFGHYRKTGDIPAPYYAWRIAVILGKSKEYDLERQFLAAWCRHFGHRGGARYAAIHARAKKKGAL